MGRVYFVGFHRSLWKFQKIVAVSRGDLIVGWKSYFSIRVIGWRDVVVERTRWINYDDSDLSWKFERFPCKKWEEGEKLWPIYGRRVCPLNGSDCHRHTRSVLRRGFDVVNVCFLRGSWYKFLTDWYPRRIKFLSLSSWICTKEIREEIASRFFSSFFLSSPQRERKTKREGEKESM